VVRKASDSYFQRGFASGRQVASVGTGVALEIAFGAFCQGAGTDPDAGVAFGVDGFFSAGGRESAQGYSIVRLVIAGKEVCYAGSSARRQPKLAQRIGDGPRPPLIA
jgi:hypothetical protein